jgi:DNA-directed RNA polymerase
MGLDPVGARATNLAGGERQDIYSEVAEHVAKAVEADAAAGVMEALEWHGRVNRDVVKRCVMTTPYGVTDRGIRRQLVLDGHVPEAAVSTSGSADYLGDKLVAALGETIQAGKAIMAWLQTTAHRLAEAGLPFDWTTPTGSRCRQAYWVCAEKRVKTLLGDVILKEEVSNSTLAPRKQALGSAPNFIHSFDAAHLAMTVNAAYHEGVSSFAMIHDSYGTHAGNTTRLARVLREQFVRIYSEDWLAKTAAEIQGYAPHVQLPPLPARGDFEVQQVLDAPFFFS